MEIRKYSARLERTSFSLFPCKESRCCLSVSISVFTPSLSLNCRLRESALLDIQEHVCQVLDSQHDQADLTISFPSCMNYYPSQLLTEVPNSVPLSEFPSLKAHILLWPFVWRLTAASCCPLFPSFSFPPIPRVELSVGLELTTPRSRPELKSRVRCLTN